MSLEELAIIGVLLMFYVVTG